MYQPKFKRRDPGKIETIWAPPKFISLSRAFIFHPNAEDLFCNIFETLQRNIETDIHLGIQPPKYANN